jgi:hypothetical protein
MREDFNKTNCLIIKAQQSPILFIPLKLLRPPRNSVLTFHIPLEPLP